MPDVEDFNRVVILGAGAIGSIIGARLSTTIPTLLVGRAEHVACIQAHGLKIGGNVQETIQVDAAETLPDDLSSTLILITTKTTTLAAAGSLLAKSLTPTTTVVLTCNGYRPEDRLRETLGTETPIHRVLIRMGAHFVAPGQVDYWGGGGIYLPDTPLGKQLGALFEKAGFNTELFGDFNLAVWRKLTANCIVNPLTALLRVRNSAVVVPELDDIRRGIVEECRAAASTDGVELPDDYLERFDEYILKSNNVSSMLQDVLHNRETEIEDLNGAVVRLGAERGFPTPLNTLFTQLMQACSATPGKVMEE